MTLVLDDAHDSTHIRQKTASTTNSTRTRFFDLSTSQNPTTTGTKLTDINTVFYEHLNVTPSSLRPTPLNWSSAIRASSGANDVMVDMDIGVELKLGKSIDTETVSVERVAIGAGAGVLAISAALLFANEISSRVYIDGTVGLVGVITGVCFMIMAKLPRQ